MPPRSSPSITSTTKRAKCLSGSHSSNDGGRRNAVRRSKSRKLLIAIKPPFGANQWRDSSENQRRWVKSDRLLGCPLDAQHISGAEIDSLYNYTGDVTDWTSNASSTYPAVYNLYFFGLANANTTDADTRYTLSEPQHLNA